MNYQYPLLGGIGVVAVLVIMYAAVVMTVPHQTAIDSVENTGVESSMTSQEQSLSQIQITDGIKHIVPLDKIKSGGPPKEIWDKILEKSQAS
ncbi:MAG TPA: hypothetical protein VGA92_08660 [Candidatus Nitrosotenuis sp.]